MKTLDEGKHGEKMAFQFMIEAVTEVHRDPLGHYHHWTVLGGRLIEGNIKRGDLIKIPLRDGTVLVAYILDFMMFAQSLGPEISADQLDQPFGLTVWRPAPHESQVELDIAVDCTKEDFEHNLIESLRHHPQRIFHNRGNQAPHLDCKECASQVFTTPEVEKILNDL